MLQIASATTEKLVRVLTAANGLSSRIADISFRQGLVLPEIASHQIIAQNVAPELSEHSTVTKYPLVYVYCGKLVNALREKFRTFSGVAQMLIEARVSQDRLDSIESNLQVYIDAITQVLDSNRGDWGDGVMYAGGYEVNFGGVKQGGRNFIQIARVSFHLEVSSD